MAKNVVWGAGGAAMLAAIALGVVGPRPAATRAAARAAAGGEPAVRGPANPPAAGAARRAGAAVLARSLPPAAGAAPQVRPGSCDFDVLIATLPDPVDSSLDFAFDSHLASIRSAFEETGYVLDRASLPWFDADGSLRQRGPDEDAAPWESTPGVMLFRRAAARACSLRLLYLVSETPTGGVAKAALRAALDEGSELARSGAYGAPVHPREVRLVAPFLSGSAPSLRAVLDAWLAAQADPKPAVRIVSGTATSFDNLAALTGRGDADPGCADAGKPLAPAQVCFAATLHSDDDLRWMFDDALSRIDRTQARVALLEESSTAYGQEAAGQGAAKPAPGAKHAARSAPSVLRIPFPMSISTLRTAYLANAAAEPAGAPAVAPTARVPLNLQEAGHHKGSFAPASALTPAYLDLFLAQVVATLSDRDVNLLGVVATDIRDKVFLATEIHKRLPAVALFTLESDLLYLWPDYNEDLRGMLVLSTYPLFHRNRFWTRPGSPPARSFPSDGAEGIFNATLLQLDAARLADYASPEEAFGAGGERRPPVWLTAVGRSSFIPLRLATAPPARKAYLALRPSESELPSLRALPLPSVLRAAAWLLGIPTAVLAAAHLRRRIRARRDRPGGAAAPSPERVSLALHHDVYLSALLLTVANVFMPVALMAVGYFPGFNVGAGLTAFLVALEALLLAATLAGAGSAAALLVGAARTRGGLSGLLLPAGRSPRAVAMSAVEALARWAVVFLAIWFTWRYFQFLSQVAGLADVERTQAGRAIGPLLLFYQHLVQFDSGLSPLPPLLLIALVLALGCAWNLRRIQLLRADTPFAAALAADPAPAGWAEFAADVRRVRRRLQHVVPDAGALLLAAAIGGVALALWGRFVWSLETLVLGGPHHGLSAFDLMLRAGVLLAVASVPWAVYRFASVWIAFHEFLRRLAATPMGSAFDRLPAGTSRLSGLLWADPAGSPRLAAAAQAAWRRLRAAPEAEPAPDVARGLPGVEGSTEFLAAATGRLLPRLDGAWRPADAAPSAAADGDAKAPPPAAPAWRERAEEFVAVQIVGYVEHVVGHLWSLAVVLLATVVLIAALLTSYPFGPQSLVRFAYMVALSGAAALFIGVSVQMSRDETLSRITKTDPGKVTWDINLVVKLVLFGLGPLAAVIGSQFASLRGALTSWVQPLLDALTRG